MHQTMVVVIRMLLWSSVPFILESVEPTAMQGVEPVVCSHIGILLCVAGGMRKGFCILMLYQLLNIFLYGMKTLG